MRQSIPIIADVPSAQPKLGFEEYGAALGDAIRGGTPPQFTIGIYGPWGSGKSSLLNAIMLRLEQYDDVIPVLFDAWRYERSGPIVVPLLHKIYAAAGNVREEKVRVQLKRALAALLFSMKFSLKVVELDMEKLRHAPGAEPDLTQLDDAFAKPFHEMQQLAQTLGDKRIAVLVDDLDRCSPDSVVGLLEAINLVMDVPGMVFVLALDYDVLVEAVRRKYPHADGHAFIEKMVQVPFRVPRLDLRPRSFLRDLIQDWDQRAGLFPDDFLEYAYDVATMALDANPRQIKRFVNSYLVLLEVGRGRGLDEESELLAGLVGLQLRWPAEYQAFTEAVFFGHEEPVLVLQRDDASNALTRYSARFLQHVPSTERIRRLLQLTETVGFLPTAESLPQGAAIHTGLAAELVKHGFSPVEGEPAIFTNPRSPNLRFVFGPTRVRAERRVRGRDWDVAGEFQPADMLNYGLTRFVPEYRPGGAAARQ